VFLLMCQPPEIHAKSNVPLRDTVLFNPDWDRIYSSSQSSKHTSWKSALRDDRDRSDKPYYCPVGWKRLSIRVKNAESGEDFYERFKRMEYCLSWHQV